MIIGLAARKLHFDRTRAKLCFAINDFEVERSINKKLPIKQAKKKRKVILEIMIVSQCFIKVLSVAINVSRKIIIVADNVSRKNR